MTAAVVFVLVLLLIGEATLLLRRHNPCLRGPSTARSPVVIGIRRLPAKYNEHLLNTLTVWNGNQNCESMYSTSSKLYSSEVWIHRELELKCQDGDRSCTHDIDKADFVFVPFYSTCARHSRQADFVALVKSLREQLVAEQRWQRNSGNDYVLVASHDSGPEAFRGILPEPIYLSPTGETRYRFVKNKDIVIPPHVDARIASFVTFGKRKHVAMLSSAYNTDPAYSGGVRQFLFDHFTKAEGFAILNAWDANPHYHNKSGWEVYGSLINESTFCLCPPGWAEWTGRFFDMFGNVCIPVLFPSDDLDHHHDMPFDRRFDYTKFSVRIPRTRMADLGQILGNVSELEVIDLQRSLVQYGAEFWYNEVGFHNGRYSRIALRRPRGRALDNILSELKSRLLRI